MQKEVQSDLNKKYLAAKSSLGLHPRYFEVFEYKHGLTDGKPHTLKECGAHFGVSSTRIAQIEARVLYQLEEIGE